MPSVWPVNTNLHLLAHTMPQSDYDMSDNDDEYEYDEDEEMQETQDDGTLRPAMQTTWTKTTLAESSISEQEMDDDLEDFQVQPQREKKRSYEVDFESLDAAAIESRIRRDADQIISIFGVEVRPAVLERTVPEHARFRCGSPRILRQCFCSATWAGIPSD